MHGGMPVMSDALETSACCSGETSAMQSGSWSGSPLEACSNAACNWGTGAESFLPQQGPTCCACRAPPLPWSPPDEGRGGSGTVRHDMAGIMVLLQLEKGGWSGADRLAGGDTRSAVKQGMAVLLLLNHHTTAHLSGMERIRWLNSLRALMVRPLAGWCAASRISWSQKELISAERREARVGPSQTLNKAAVCAQLATLAAACQAHYPRRTSSH